MNLLNHIFKQENTSNENFKRKAYVNKMLLSSLLTTQCSRETYILSCIYRFFEIFFCFAFSILACKFKPRSCFFVSSIILL